MTLYDIVVTCFDLIRFQVIAMGRKGIAENRGHSTASSGGCTFLPLDTILSLSLNNCDNKLGLL